MNEYEINYQSGKTIGPVISERQLNTVPPKIFCGPRSTFLMKFSLLPHLDSQTFPFFSPAGQCDFSRRFQLQRVKAREDIWLPRGQSPVSGGRESVWRASGPADASKYAQKQIPGATGKKILARWVSVEAFDINNIPCRMMKVGQTFFSFNPLETRV